MNVFFEVVGKIWARLSQSTLFWYAVIGFALYLVYRKINPVGTNFLDTPLPNSGSGIPQGWKPDSLVEEFHNYYSSLWSASGDIYSAEFKANNLTDDQFVALVKTYNARYAQSDGNKTLWNRSFNGWFVRYVSFDTNQHKPFLARMVKLKQNYQ